MEEWTLYGSDGCAVGTLRGQREGLYVALEAATPRCFAGIGRVYLRGGGGERLLGVMEPFGGGMRCRRRFAEMQLRTLGSIESAVLRVAGDETDWAAYGGELAGEWGRRLAGKGALWRREGELLLLALPYGEGAEFPLTELFCLAEIRILQGKRHVVYAFTGEGKPVLRA